MNSNIIKQSLTESFEVWKDSWETKKESVIKCIEKTEACDGDLANIKKLFIENITKRINFESAI